MDILKINLALKYRALIAGFFITALAVIVYLIFTDSGFLIEVILGIVGAGIALTAVVYTVMKVHMIYEYQEKESKRKSKEFSITLMTQWNSPDLADAIYTGRELRKQIKDMDPEKAINLLKNDKNKEIAMVSILNFFEKMALTIKYKIADEEMLRDYFRGIVIKYHYAFKEFINYKRQELENEKVLCEFENLAKSWSEK